MSAEGGFPFFTFCNANKVVGVIEVNFCECTGFLQCIKQVRDEWKRITILLADFVKSMIVDTKS